MSKDVSGCLLMSIDVSGKDDKKDSGHFLDASRSLQRLPRRKRILERPWNAKERIRPGPNAEFPSRRPNFLQRPRRKLLHPWRRASCWSWRQDGFQFKKSKEAEKTDERKESCFGKHFYWHSCSFLQSFLQDMPNPKAALVQTNRGKLEAGQGDHPEVILYRTNESTNSNNQDQEIQEKRIKKRTIKEMRKEREERERNEKERLQRSTFLGRANTRKRSLPYLK